MTDADDLIDDDNERKGRMSGVYRSLSWADRIRNFWTWLTGGTGAGTAVIITAAALTILPPALRVGAVALDPDRFPAVRSALGQDATLYVISGTDRAGRRAGFDVIVLRKDITWVKGSTDRIVRGSDVVDGARFKRTVFENELGERISAARELVAVGVASAEGDLATEEMRAGERAQKIGTWLAEGAGAEKRIWRLNLGQYRDVCTECETNETSWQRPIIVIGVSRADPDVDLGQALADAMSRSSNLPAPGRYSRFDFKRL